MSRPDAEAASIAVDLALAIVRLRARLRLESSSDTWTWPQLSTLARVIDEGPLTVSDLAKAEHLRPQSMAAIMAALKNDGLVQAKADPHDGRKTLITATAKGRAVVDELEGQREEWLTTAIMSLIEPGEYRDLREAVKLIKRLADAQRPHGRRATW
jgi:DNA-binding MarR family transcriptional regulator